MIRTCQGAFGIGDTSKGGCISGRSLAPARSDVLLDPEPERPDGQHNAAEFVGHDARRADPTRADQPTASGSRQ
jgi:hypothetical protein